ncbi:MAG TPA: 3-hydroxyisobutyryl-CoA hydrolase [Rhizomicrobium sp.]
MPESEPHILFEKRGALGLITLNRPKALNALTHGMCIGMQKALEEWARDAEIKAVAIQGAGPRAFCAGGDIRSMAESSAQGSAVAANFLRDEYRLNAMIGAYPKPYIAMTHGVVMGGGAGVSVHGRYRLADEDLAFAMPETGIGFIPDIGSSFFLSRCPDHAGVYLALTGGRIGLGDAIALGLFTHSVARAAHAVLIERLAAGENADMVVTAFARTVSISVLAESRSRIDVIFSALTVEAVLERLDRDDSAFSTDTARLIRTRCPVSLKLALELIHRGKGLARNDCLKMEYRVGARRVMSADFREGVRAVLLDKDNAPRWAPDALAGVSEADIAGYFAELGTRELLLPDNVQG